MKTLLTLLCLCSIAKAQSFRSETANHALLIYRKAEARARMDYFRDVDVSRKRLLRSLQTVLKNTTQAGDLKEATKLDAAIKQIEDELPTPARSAAKGKAAATTEDISGNWEWKFSRDSVIRKTTVAKDGTFTSVHGHKNQKGKVVAQNGVRYLAYDGSNSSYVVYFIGDRMFVEGYSGRNADTSGVPKYVGSGRRVKP